MKKFLVSLFLIMLVVGCATVWKLPTKPEVLTTLHFITFRTIPPGADVLVIDLFTGRESAMLGKTPVKILILKKQIEVHNNGQRKLLNVTPTFPGPITVGKKSVEGAEFQFKFRLQGYYDEMVIERIPLTSDEETDKILNINLTRIGENK